MRAGRKTSGADVADNLALFYSCARFDSAPKVMHVRIERLVALAVLKYHCVAVPAFTPGVHNFAITCGFDRRTACCCVICALMCANRMQHRMLAIQVKVRADTCKIYRHPQE